MVIERMTAMLARIALLGVALALFALPAAAQPASVAGSQVTFTPNSSAYSAGLCLGGVIAAPNLVRPHGPGGANLTGVTFVDPAHQTAANDALTILVFNVKPIGTYTDHSNCQLAATDIPLLVGVVSIASSNCAQDQGPTNTVCTITPTLPVSAPTAVYSLATSATSAAGSATLTFSSVPAYIKPGQVVADTTASGALSAGTLVTGTTSTTVTINPPVTATTVGSGDTITFTQTQPTINNSLWFVPIVVATPTYGSNNLTFSFFTTPYAGN